MMMNSKQMALYSMMEERGYSEACITTTIMMLRQDRIALDDMIIYIDDEHPSEEQITDRIAEMFGR